MLGFDLKPFALLWEDPKFMLNCWCRIRDFLQWFFEFGLSCFLWPLHSQIDLVCLLRLHQSWLYGSQARVGENHLEGQRDFQKSWGYWGGMEWESESPQELRSKSSLGSVGKSSWVHRWSWRVLWMCERIVIQRRVGGEGWEWKILLFLSFHIFQTMKPGKSCHVLFKIGILKEP